MLIAVLVGPVVAAIPIVQALKSYRQEQCNRLRSNAIDAYHRHDWRFASRKLGDYLRCDPEDQVVLRLCIESTYEAHNFPEAHYWIDRAKLAFPGDPVPEYWTGVLLIFEHQDFAHALTILKDIHFSVEDQYPRVNLYIGMALIKSGELAAGCDSVKYYLNSPQQENDLVRRAADGLYRRRCGSATP